MCESGVMAQTTMLISLLSPLDRLSRRRHAPVTPSGRPLTPRL